MGPDPKLRDLSSFVYGKKYWPDDRSRLFPFFTPSTVNEIDSTESERQSGDQSGSTNFAVLTTCDRFILLSEHRGHAAPPEEAREVNDQDERRQDVATPGTQSTDGALSPQFS